MIPFENIKDYNQHKILRYSFDRFLNEGFAKISIETICKDLRISKKTFYKYFNSKEDLINQMIILLSSHVEENLFKITNSEKNSINKMIDIILLIINVIPKFSDKWLYDIKNVYPLIWNKIDNIRSINIKKKLSVIIKQGKAENLIKDYPDEIIITLILEAIRKIVNPEFILQNNLSFIQAAYYIYDLILSGILTNKGNKIYSKYKKANYEKILSFNF